MTPRPDLSNDAVAVETGDAELSVYAFPRYRGRTFVMTVLGTILSLTPLMYIGKPLDRYYHRGHRVGDIVEPMMYGIPFVLAMAVLANAFVPNHATATGNWAWRGMKLGFFCWFGFVLPTSFATSLFSMKPRQLWLIDTGYNLVSFVIAGAIILGWMGATAR